MRPDEVSAQDTIGVLPDQCLEAVDRFVESPGRVPIGSLLRMQSEFDPLRARLRLAEANRGNWRNRECDARNAAVVRPVPVAVEKVCATTLPSWPDTGVSGGPLLAASPAA